MAQRPKKIKHSTPAWKYNGEEFTEDMVGKHVGFVYLITHLPTGKKYIGKKIFVNTNRVVQKGKINKKVVKKPSDWQFYWGSSKEFLDFVEEHEYKGFRREILSIHLTKGDANFHEMKEQVIRDVLNDYSYFNANILCRWYRKKTP